MDKQVKLKKMIGTIENTCTIIVGSIAGAAMNRGIKEKYKETLYTGLGLACLGIGLNAVISNFNDSKGFEYSHQ